ncbi:MAG: ANTAR domain-containing protein [Clostridia bacterium]|nr:ANTAR domain-containing protein [Clostridia bacterium]MBQ5956880.1 ANTAR domain-containing protein [Clostridia bacterium]MBQ6003924.1 ANTAR domain-containing protein [Clostridia bacterium]
MELRERSYSVLVVSAAEKLNTAVSSMLLGSCFGPVRVVQSVSEAKRAWNERGYDLVIVNSPLPDDPGVGFAIDVTASRSSVALLLVSSDVYDRAAPKASEYGVFTLFKPLSRQILELALNWMQASCERLKKLERKSITVEDKMKEIRTVNHAKWILISNKGMEEPEAHRYIEKQAMDRGVSKLEIAEEIIRAYT